MTFLQDYGFIFTTQFDPGYDKWWAIKVYQDGVPIMLERFDTEDEADDFVEQVKADYRAAIKATGDSNV